MTDNGNLESSIESTEEEVINPELPICDPHHHLWDGPGDRGRYLFREYLADAQSGHNIVKTVFVECGTGYRQDGPKELRPIGETEFVLEQTKRSTVNRTGKTAAVDGIVAFADLLLGEKIVKVLEAHIEAGGDILKGIRQICIWDSDPAVTTMGNSKGMMMESKFREGFACLSNFGLVFDAWQYFTQLMELKDLAENFPDTIIIVNHTGGPLGIGSYRRKREEAFKEWKKNIIELAKCPNVYMKLGGLGMPRCGFGWHERPKPIYSMELAAALKPYFAFCIEEFGIGRCMFESNFPVDKISYSYAVLWNAFKLLSEGFSHDELAAIFHDNAVRVYGLRV